MRNHGPLLFFAAASLTLPAAGCFVTTDEPPPSRTVVIEPTEPPESQEATLIVKWTIAGLTDPNECIKAQVANIEVSVIDTGGTEVGAFQQTCTAFSTSIRLRPGSYSAFAVLLDQGGRTRTTDAAIAPFTLRANESLTVPVDFPSNSFR